MSIASDLTAVATNLNSALDEINTKIEAKGGTASETVYGVAAAVENLPSGGETTSPNIIKAGTLNPSPIQLSNGSWFLPSSDSYNWGKLRSSATTDISINPSQSQIRYVVKFKQTSNITNWGKFISGDNRNEHFPHMGINSDTRKIYSQLLTPSSEWMAVYADYVIELNTWYYACLYFSAENIFCSLYGENGTRLASGCRPYATPTSETNKILLGGNIQSGGFLKNSEIDLSETFVELNGMIIWGKTNSKTQNMGIFDFTDFSEFTEVEYIESTGTQCIDTGIVDEGNFEVDIDSVSFKYNSTEVCFVSTWNTTDNYFNLFYTPIRNLDLYATGHNSSLLSPVEEVSYSLSIHRSGSSWNAYMHRSGESIETSVSYSGLSNTTTIKLLCRGDLLKGNGIIKIGKTRIKKNASLVRDFIPCYHTQTGMIGMFDTVNNKFYMNAGTGTFLKGADVNA